MTAPLTAPPPGVTGWTVPVAMPRFQDGKRSGELVGWLTTNTKASTVQTQILHNKIQKLWRQAAYNAYRAHKLPQGLGRVFVTVQFAKTARSRLKDSPNMELIVKPIIDALQPEKKIPYQARNRRTGRLEWKVQHHIGWGVVHDDNDRWVVRGQQQPWLPNVPATVGGLVVVTIVPFPEAPALHQA